MPLINLYFRIEPPRDRFFKGDHHLVWLIKRLIKPRKISGLEKVFINLCKGLDSLNIGYRVNPSFEKIKAEDPVVVLGCGRHALNGYRQPNVIIAGIGLMTHPNEWPGLFNEYPVVKYLQHSPWTNAVYASRFGLDKCDIWPAGIDTGLWAPKTGGAKQTDFLIYNKIMWNKAETDDNLRMPLLQRLEAAGYSYHEIVYGGYTEAEYFKLLQTCRAMIFLCEHESQGFACCEAMSMNVPVFAWDQGYWLDPNRFRWDDPVVEASSVPFFDERCGMQFKDFHEFDSKLDVFWKNAAGGYYEPRNYVLENLTLKKSAAMMLKLIDDVYGTGYFKTVGTRVVPTGYRQVK